MDEEQNDESIHEYPSSSLVEIASTSENSTNKVQPIHTKNASQELQHADLFGRFNFDSIINDAEIVSLL